VRRALPGLCALAGLAVSSTLWAAAPPAALFAAEPEYDVVAISPHGTRIVRTGMYKDRQTLIGIDVAQRKSTPLLHVDSDEYSVSMCRFKNEDYVVCSARVTDFIDGRPFPVTRIFSVKYDDPKPLVLIRSTSLAESQYHDIIDWMRKDPTHVLVETSEDGSIYPAVYSVDVVSGRRSRVLYPREPILRWMTDGDGVVRFGYGHDSNQRVTYITRSAADEPWRELMKASAFETPFDALGFSPTPNTMFVSAAHNGRDAIFELDLGDTKDLQLVFAHPSVDVDRAIRWPSDRRIVGFSFETERPQVDLFDSGALLAQRTLDQALPGAVNRVVSATDDGKRLVISSVTDVKPTTYYLLDHDARTILRLGSEYPGLESQAGAAMRPVQIAARNGIVLPGYLSVPPGSDGKNLPTIVFPHGGPHARDSWEYDIVRQFLVSRGYAVVQVNFRGSTGYGSEWYEAGLRNWGTVMVDDITAAARWAIAQGVADPARMCIVGWSFGGYAALMSAVREPKLYRCAVSIAGVSDLRSLILQESRFFGGRVEGEYLVGDDRKELDAGSPLRSANKIEVPVLMVHGTADIQVVIDHSRKMAQALTREHKPNELVVIDGGDHALHRSAWRLTLYSRLESFLGEHLAGAATAVEAGTSATAAAQDAGATP